MRYCGFFPRAGRSLRANVLLFLVHDGPDDADGDAREAGAGHRAPKVNTSNSAAKIDLYMIFLPLYGLLGLVPIGLVE